MCVIQKEKIAMRRGGEDEEEDLMKRNSYFMERNMPSRAFSGKIRVDLS